MIFLMNMKFNKKLSKSKKKGFTLIELVAVLAIIAILSAALIPNFSNYITEAKKVTVLNEAKTVVTAYEAARSKIDSNETSTDIKYLINNNYINAESIDKIPHDFSIADCKNLMNTEKYTFNIENGTVSELKPLNSSTSE